MSDPRNPLVEDVELEIEEEIDGEIPDGDEIGDAAGDEAGEGVDGAEGDEEEGQARDVAPRARSRETIKALRERAQTAERAAAEVDNIRRELQELRSRPAPFDPAAAARAAAEEQERVRQMLPDEVARYYADKTQQEVRQQLAQFQLQNFDQQDSAAFGALRRSNSAAERLAPQVDALLRQRRAQGMYDLGREQIFTYLYGQEMLSRANRAAPGQRRAAARRIAGQSTQPGTPRGGVARGPANGRDADAEMLQRITLDEFS